MLKQNDWRLTNQMNYLYGKTLVHENYKKFSDSWDHDHCEFCNDKIGEDTKLYYCTLDHYHWICEKCFEDFKNIFNWKVN